MEEESTKKFISNLISLSRVLTATKDNFFYSKFYLKFSNFLYSFLEANKEGEDVAQYNKDLLNQISGLLEFLEYLDHLKIIEPAPLLIAQRNLLNLKFSIIKYKNIQGTSALKENMKNNSTKRAIDFEKLNLTQKKIVEFVKKSNQLRVKEIIDEFNIMSGRTIKRNLKELIDFGLISKKSEDKITYYSFIK